MPKWNHNQARKKFLEFFASKGCKPLASSGLVPKDDPSTLFTSAGMHQFKDDFTGNLRHRWPDGRPVSRATTVQKCLRTPDLENVGRTARHHTFFEMLGFFSFGDYFKKEAIAWFWEFYTSPEWVGLPVERLSVSVYKDDDEAYGYWRDLVPELHEKGRIYRFDEHENFWPAGAPSQGPNGVCGPCSEVFYDRGEAYGEGDPASNGDRYMEVGNIVFTQFERSGPVPGVGTLTPLPSKNIDFGGGFERLMMVLENAETTLDTSLFLPVREKLRELGQLGKPESGAEAEVREKRIADHIRAAVFCMADGVLPSNEKQGYIIRRILRRAYRDGAALGFQGPFLHKLVETVVGDYGESYPELRQHKAAIEATIKQEETTFGATLERGLARLEGEIRNLQKHGHQALSGEVAFDLYSTYGLPVDVTRDELRARKLDVDEAGFEVAFEKFKELSRGTSAFKGDVFQKGWFSELKLKARPTAFVGYENAETKATVVGISREEELVDTLDAGSHAILVLDQTPFYAESGGQVGDTGVIALGEMAFEVHDTRRKDDYVLHTGVLKSGRLHAGDRVDARVDDARRGRIRANHSATHLMHAALRKVLGEHVVQRGSEVGPERLRFDFAHGKAMTFEQKQEVERLVNAEIRANTEICTDLMSPEQARQAGAMALFGEKYGDEVRVLSMGSGGDRPFSRELCGGTHARRTGDIGLFRIVAEGSSSAGVRRVEAVTGQDAMEIMLADAATLAKVESLVKAQPGKVVERVEGLQKELKEQKSKAGKGGADRGLVGKLASQAASVGGARVVVTSVDGVDQSELLTIRDALGQDIAPSAVLLGSTAEGKAFLAIRFSPEVVARGLHAGKLIGELARMVGGGGGGKPDQAQAGGREPAGMPKALETGLEKIRAALE